MTTFADNRKHLSLVNPPEGKKGLRDSQFGAVMAAAAHFTVSRDPALVCMPTGSGKTAVLMTLCYLLSARKVLIVTPSQLVRRQIAKDFQELATLRRLGILPEGVEAPQVTEVKNKVKDEAMWKKLLDENDVLVATPNSVSPSPKGGVAVPPDGAFDVVVVDEAHHSRAKTWANLLAQFPDARQILLTATPFRNDQRDIRARFVYNYPLRKAVDDETFGEIRYVPVDASESEVDAAIARRVEELFKQDRAKGLDHRVIVRTSRKDRADELEALYKTHAPSLRLSVVSSNKAMSVIEKAIDGLEKDELDGIICVDMLGEGFDMPNLKIAGLHAPHKSLAITLQFIGRFARTVVKSKDKKIGQAKFVAALNDMEIERAKLYQEDADWKRIIVDLSERRIDTELSAQAFFEAFDEVKTPLDGDSPQYLSKASFRPFCHVKVYEVDKGFRLDAKLESERHDVIFHEISDTYQTAIITWATRKKPKWLKDDLLRDVAYEMAVIHYHPQTRLLFICSTDRRDELYAHVLERFVSGSCRELPLTVLRRSLAGWKDEHFSSVGMRSRRYRLGTESYQIKSGQNAHLAIHESDGQNYVGGHHFGGGKDEKDQPVLLGLSSTSKMWTIKYVSIPELVMWCDALAVKVADEKHDKEKLPLAMFDYGTQIKKFPKEKVFAGEWHNDAYANGRRVCFVDAAGKERILPLGEFRLTVDPKRSNQDRIVFAATYEGDHIEFELVLKPFPAFSALPKQACKLYICHGHEKDRCFVTYLNHHSPMFYFEDMAHVIKDVYIERKVPVRPFPEDRLHPVDWGAAKVDWYQEVETKEYGLKSIHDHLKEALKPLYDVLIYDQGSGEIADFIGLKRGPAPKLVLYHCKGMKKARKGKPPTKPGKRVDDLYEVGMQAIKSARWADKKELLDNLKNPTRTVRKYLKGKLSDAEQILTSMIGQDLAMEVYIVQPGIATSPELADKLAHLLGAVDEHLFSSSGSILRVMCS